MLVLHEGGTLILAVHRDSILCWHAGQNVGGIELFQVSIASQLALDLCYLRFQVLNDAARYGGVLISGAEACAGRLCRNTL